MEAAQGFDKVIGTYQSADHTTGITSIQYVPHGVDKEHPPRAIVQVIHGMCEYLERYEHFAAFLTQQGVILCGEDHLGHGRSAASEYDLGYFGEKNGHLHLAEDSYALTRKMQMQYGEVPYFYFGHSMGSFILRDLLARFHPRVSGAVICGTAGGNQPFGLAKLLIGGIRLCKGSHYRSNFINKLMFGSYCSKIENPSCQHDWITTDAEIVKAYAADPKCNYIFTIAAMGDLVRLLERVSHKDWAGKVSKDLPLFLIAGEADPVGSYGEGVKKVYERLAAGGGKGYFHEIVPE